MASTADTSSAPQEDLLAKNDADFVAGFDKLYEQAWGEGAIPAKYKELSGVTLSVVTRCEPCLAYHLRMAVNAGARAPELIEAMRIGLLSGGSVTIPTVRSGYLFVKELGLL